MKIITIMYEYLWATKWLLDEASSLVEMADRLEAAATELRRMAATHKIEMSGVVDNGMVMLTTEDAQVATDFGFSEVEPDEEDDEEEYDENEVMFEGGDQER